MDHLTMDLVRLCKRNRDGAFGTQNNRQRGLTAMAWDLKDLGFTLKSCHSLKPKHVDALVNQWRDNGISKATMRNRMSWLRWWAVKIDKVSILHKDNTKYELIDTADTQSNVAKALKPEQLDQLTDNHVRAAVMLQSAFGLRREEALKIVPSQAIKSDCIRLKGSWTKGGRPRTIPIVSQHQRAVLAGVQHVAGEGSLIPTDRTYAQHLRTYERQIQKAGIKRAHSLRHAYAQHRYETLTGLKCPLNGGPSRSLMTDEQYELDRQARARVSKELGHVRLSISDIYLGRLITGKAAS